MITLSDNGPLGPSANIVYLAIISIPGVKFSFFSPVLDLPKSPVRIPLTMPFSSYNISDADVDGNISTPNYSAY